MSLFVLGRVHRVFRQSTVVLVALLGCDPGRDFTTNPGDADRSESNASTLRPEPETSGVVPRTPGELGATCSSAAECSSGFCSAGRCCESACNGLCEACSERGRCDIASADDARCPPIECDASTSCIEFPIQQTTNRCAERGACKTECDPTRIAVHAVCDRGTPGAVGQCGAQGDCFDSRSAIGGACDTAATCASGFCVDGVCCNEACDGECESCDATGTCVADLRGSSCNGDGLTCFDRGVCRRPLGAACSSAADCGSGLCEPATGGDRVCCASSCADGSVCNGDGVCVTPDSDLGQSCNSGDDCSGGRCIDGTCCDLPCDNACERCNAPGQVGRCVAADPGSTDPLCDAGRTCAGRGECKLPLGARCTLDLDCASGSCGPALAGVEICCVRTCPDGQRCDSSGSCVDAPRPLGASCTIASDCASGFCSPTGICCDSACNRVCEACNSNGQCQPTLNDDRCTDVPCDSLGVGCRVSTRLTANLCRGAGACKTTTDCTFSNVRDGTPCGVSSAGLVCQQGSCVSPRVTCGTSTCSIDQVSICCSRGVESGTEAGFSCESRGTCFESGVFEPIQPVECDSPDDCTPGNLCCLDISVGARLARVSCLPAAECNLDDSGQMRFAQLCGSLSFSAPSACPSGRRCIGTGDPSILPGFSFCGPP